MSDSILAPYAVHDSTTQGRVHPEAPPRMRTQFQRDRDRIIHSSAFRRLEYKTQVFVNHEGDLFRTRLTHSIEVAQIARGICRALQLNEDLAEAIALAHDLGHTPFGHAGQEALHACMRDYGGFEHNLQSLRIVDHLEERYATFNGLNLCFETREGIIKHCSIQNARLMGELGIRFLNKHQPSLEAQVCNLADEIAYNNHDVDDGLRSGLITLDQLRNIELFAEHIDKVERAHPRIIGRRLVHETIRSMINTLVCDLIENSAANIHKYAPNNLQELRLCPSLASFSHELQEKNKALKHFLHTQLYRHYQVLRMTQKAKKIIGDLFLAFINDPRLLPPQYQQTGEQTRAIADYIAGMTDRYAMKEHRRLFSIENI